VIVEKIVKGGIFSLISMYIMHFYEYVVKKPIVDKHSSIAFEEFLVGITIDTKASR
jgi:hypothetical protein